MTQYVVKKHRPWQFALAIILMSMLLATLTWLMLDKSHWSVIEGRIFDNKNSKLLWEVNQGLEEENTDLKERVLKLERTTSLDTQTMSVLQNELKTLQGEIYHLKQELEFYQGVMEASGAVKGLDVHGIHVEALTQKHNYRLKLILTNVAKSDKVVEGLMEISIEGIQDGTTRHIKIQDLILDSSIKLAFKFRNFNRFESNLALPEGFTPQRVFVQLQPKDKRQSIIKKTFDWPVPAT